MRAILTVGLLALAALDTSGAPIPKEAKKNLAEKLDGQWRLVKSDAVAKPSYEFTIHFKKAGELEFHRQIPDREAIVSKGKYKTGDADDANKFGTIDWTIGEGDAARGEVSKILKLNDDELVFEDPEGLVESFVRVKVEKKKDK